MTRMGEPIQLEVGKRLVLEPGGFVELLSSGGENLLYPVYIDLQLAKLSDAVIHYSDPDDEGTDGDSVGIADDLIIFENDQVYWDPGDENHYEGRINASMFSGFAIRDQKLPEKAWLEFTCDQKSLLAVRSGEKVNPWELRFVGDTFVPTRAQIDGLSSVMDLSRVSEINSYLALNFSKMCDAGKVQIRALQDIRAVSSPEELVRVNLMAKTPKDSGIGTISMDLEISPLALQECTFAGMFGGLRKSMKVARILQVGPVLGTPVNTSMGVSAGGVVTSAVAIASTTAKYGSKLAVAAVSKLNPITAMARNAIVAAPKAIKQTPKLFKAGARIIGRKAPSLPPVPIISAGITGTSQITAAGIVGITEANKGRSAASRGSSAPTNSVNKVTVQPPPPPESTE